MHTVQVSSSRWRDCTECGLSMTKGTFYKWCYTGRHIGLTVLSSIANFLANFSWYGDGERSARLSFPFPPCAKRCDNHNYYILDPKLKPSKEEVLQWANWNKSDCSCGECATSSTPHVQHVPNAVTASNANVRKIVGIPLFIHI